MGIRRDPIDQLLIQRGIDPVVIDRARSQLDDDNQNLADEVARTDGADPTLVARTVAESMGMPWLEEIELEQIDVTMVRKISLGLSREQGVLPLWETEAGRVVVAIAGPQSLHAVDDMRVLFGNRRCLRGRSRATDQHGQPRLRQGKSDRTRRHGRSG